jgi:anti-anti-sigma regulatory factor/anti-sigma regulatory factor (Ser/Thr protein kinase)
MRIEHSVRDGYVVLALVGSLDLAAATRVHSALLKRLAEEPPAIICDLTGVDEIDPLCAGIFTSVRHPALGWPDTTLVLCGVRPKVAANLARARVPSRLAVYATLGEALTHARERPPSVLDHLALAPVAGAPALARTFARRLCSRWGLGELAEVATLLASELVTNAVVHARTSLDLRFQLRGSRLSISVRDHDHRPPRLRTGQDQQESARGMLIVDRMAKNWGVDDHPGGGKVVWCALDLPADQAVRP